VEVFLMSARLRVRTQEKLRVSECKWRLKPTEVGMSVFTSGALVKF
jgi:hypothetical protein